MSTDKAEDQQDELIAPLGPQLLSQACPSIPLLLLFPLFLPLPSFSIPLNMSAHTHGSTSSTQNIVGVHYRVGKKIGEGSFGVIFEGPFPPFTPTL